MDRGVTSDTRSERVSHMTFTELVTFATALGNKIDTLWHRIIYIHVGMIAVVIFLTNSSGEHVVARLAVFCFYSFNVVITFVNLNEAYSGLSAAISDIQRVKKHASDGAVETWLKARSYTNNVTLRAVVLFVFWLAIAYIVVIPIVASGDMADHERVQNFLGFWPPVR